MEAEHHHLTARGEALAARGAAAAARAQHVERSARQGDLAAVAVLREAGEATARLAPESAARWFGGALRLLPQTAPAEDRVELLLARSWALAAVGRFTDSHQAALEAVSLVPGQPSALNTTVATATLAGNLFNRSVVALAVGDLDVALATAEESVELTRDLDEGFLTAWAAARLADVLFETGQPDRAIELLLGRAGGEELTLIPGGWRAYCLELLTRCWLALDRPSKAGRAAALAGVLAAAVHLPLAATWADRAAAAVALDAGNAALAAERALASANAADTVGASIEAALPRTIAGRALAGLAPYGVRAMFPPARGVRHVAGWHRAQASVMEPLEPLEPPRAITRAGGSIWSQPPGSDSCQTVGLDCRLHERRIPLFPRVAGKGAS